MIDRLAMIRYYADAVFVDGDLIKHTRFVRDATDFGKHAQFASFFGTYCTIRRIDGALLA
jgi:intraflagellar transport protein 80